MHDVKSQICDFLRFKQPTGVLHPHVPTLIHLKRGREATRSSRKRREEAMWNVWNPRNKISYDWSKDLTPVVSWWDPNTYNECWSEVAPDCTFVVRTSNTITYRLSSRTSDPDPRETWPTVNWYRWVLPFSRRLIQFTVFRIINITTVNTRSKATNLGPWSFPSLA